MENDRGYHLETNGNTPGSLSIDVTRAVLDPKRHENTQIDKTLLDGYKPSSDSIKV
jgi:hypothetical protein